MCYKYTQWPKGVRLQLVQAEFNVFEYHIYGIAHLDIIGYHWQEVRQTASSPALLLPKNSNRNQEQMNKEVLPCEGKVT
jgi:hypothetical protein